MNFMNLNHAHQVRHWYLFGVLFKISKEQPHQFYRRASLVPMKFFWDWLGSLFQIIGYQANWTAFNSQHFYLSFRELIPRSSSGSLFSSPESDWLDVAMVNYGGTFLESEVNELRAMRKVVVFSFLLIPYWMIYTQVKIWLHFKYCNWRL